MIRQLTVTALAGVMVATVATIPATAATATRETSSAAVVLPDEDPFYDVPSHVERKPDGAVLKWRRLPHGAVQAQAHVWQLLYKTRDNAGRATATVGTLLVPTTRWTTRGPRPLLSYQVPEDGLATFCAPSYVLRTGSVISPPGIGQVQFDREQVAAAVRRGWTVMVPDYEGPNSEFFGASGTASGILDGIRAARSFDPARVDRSAPIGLWGYSGGGFATAVAAQKQAGYAPELKITGIVGGGVAADLNASLRAMSGKVYSGWIPFGFAALRNAYPEANVDRYLNASARAYADRVAHVCAGEAIVAGPHFASLEQFEAWPGSLTTGAFRRLAHRASPIGLGGTPSAPVYMYHGTADELLPVEGARKLAAQYRARGTRVVLIEHEGKNHGDEQRHGVAGAIAFLEGSFAKRVP